MVVKKMHGVKKKIKEMKPKNKKRKPSARKYRYEVLESAVFRRVGEGPQPGDAVSLTLRDMDKSHTFRVAGTIVKNVTDLAEQTAICTCRVRRENLVLPEAFTEIVITARAGDRQVKGIAESSKPL